MMRGVRRALGGILRQPTVGIALLIILLLLGISVYAMIRYPLSEAIDLWRPDNVVWVDSPKVAQPVWTNLFRRQNLPPTTILRMGDAEARVEPLSATMRRETTVLAFDLEDSMPPSEVTFFYNARWDSKRPHLKITWIRPDGMELEVFNDHPVRGGEPRIRISDELGLVRLFGPDPNARAKDAAKAPALSGEYELRIEALVLDEGYAMDGRLVVYGGVHGIAGTDIHRRDLTIALLWGTPIALMFGLLATLGTTIVGFAVAAIGAWFGGWVDAAIQRLTEVSMMIPFIPTILMVGWWFSKSIWVILGFIIGLNLLSGALKSYRAMFLQAKNAPYIEAAKTYGASHWRIIFRYLIPHIAPALLPHLVLGIPRFVFLETSIGLLGVADPTLPTWGKILSESRDGIYMGYFHWVLEPAFMLALTGLSFSMLGYALDRVFNPRLRSA
jgi:peptide/nickel transport system permease protein